VQGNQWLIATIDEDAEMGMLKAVLVFLRAMLIPSPHAMVTRFRTCQSGNSTGLRQHEQTIGAAELPAWDFP
jgi:hypothetical protein